MRKIYQLVGLLVVLLGLNACAALSGNYEKPQVNITSFTLAPNTVGVAPRFDIGIQIINPNRSALPFRGMTYAVEIEGYRILSGATPDIPTVPAYGQADFVIQASPDLFGSARLLGDLFSNTQRQSLNYSFNARLDAGRLLPMINIEETGQLKLTP
ncbi:lipoprotein [Nitrincola sp. A-D6]|uniref:LEA type 2 family protein n=1 Tax=Nitrincola sp. A-D6 TaxID=1545442 RepID=UPI00051FE338|nr:LEA type 2 family protein [Nitrincola sp. A-D6]KGK41417.1 lipoprotein [Nitrincola sp. A-D6]